MLAWDHGGDGRMVVLEEDWRDYATGEEEEAWTFLDRLGLPILDGPSDDGPPVVPRISLYRIDDIAVEGFDPARLDAYRVPLPGSYIPDRSYLGGPRSICALDAGTELFLWTGSAADPSAGTDLLAALVPLDPRRPRWTDVRRFRDGSGPTSESFRQKFARWEERGQFDPLSMVKPPRPPPAVDWGPLLGPSLPDPPPADDLSVSGLTHDADDADAQISSFLFSERTRTFLSHPARPPLDDETWVHLHSRPSVPSCAAYLWRGRHAPLLGRAAFLLRTTGQLAEAVAERWGCKLEVVDAPQGREPDALLGLLGGYVEVRRREARDGMMHLRAAKCRVRATEVLASVARLDCFGAAILQRGQGGPVLWIGRRARRAAREALLDACAEILAGRSASRPSVVEQGSEPEWFWDLLPDGASHHLAELAPARLLTVSCAEGLYRIAEEQPEQWNLRRASCALVFRLGAEAYLWIGAEASEAVRRFAAETIGRFEAITGHKVEEVLQGEETDGFTGCFACWDERPRQLRVFSRSTVHH
ncbi:hypothetical protein DFJ74DRAFT_692764 [Hyaloraphidium curvatum]|nr:hypothetical protein DFJ74DRAFT_692764 [Hyaloraphidium curvatum]